jgi:hypothetical protein
MNTDVSDYEEFENEAKRLLKYHKSTRQFFKHLKETDIEKTSLKHDLFSLGNKVTAILRFSRKIDLATIDEMNSVAHYQNQNFIVRFYALLQEYKIIGNGIDICKDIDGWIELDILRLLRNNFAHSRGKLSSKDSKDKAVHNEIIKYFELIEEDYDPNEFPLPSTPVIVKIFKKCLDYSSEFLKRNSNGEGRVV